MFGVGFARYREMFGVGFARYRKMWKISPRLQRAKPEATWGMGRFHQSASERRNNFTWWN